MKIERILIGLLIVVCGVLTIRLELDFKALREVQAKQACTDKKIEQHEATLLVLLDSANVVSTWIKGTKTVQPPSPTTWPPSNWVIEQSSSGDNSPNIVSGGKK